MWCIEVLVALHRFWSRRNSALASKSVTPFALCWQFRHSSGSSNLSLSVDVCHTLGPQGRSALAFRPWACRQRTFTSAFYIGFFFSSGHSAQVQMCIVNVELCVETLMQFLFSAAYSPKDDFDLVPQLYRSNVVQLFPPPAIIVKTNQLEILRTVRGPISDSTYFLLAFDRLQCFQEWPWEKLIGTDGSLKTSSKR